MRVWASLILIALASPALAGPSVRCITYEEKTMGRLQTICDDGTRAVSTYNKTLGRWESTITPPGQPRRTCMPYQTSRGLEVRCQ